MAAPKSNTMTATFSTLFLLLITLSGVAQVDTKAKNYKVDEFNKIDIQGGGNLEIHHSDNYSLEIMIDGSCDDFVKASVISKTLYIAIKDSAKEGCDIAIKIHAPFLTELVQNGGGNIVLKDGFSPQHAFRCQIKGGGNTNISKLLVTSFYASIEDGGVLLVHVEKELVGNISGGGLIKYSGDPTVKSNVSGGGAISKK
jgi:hypothetical protein